jgi:hypothetical protein
MLSTRFRGLLALCAALAGCSDSAPSRSIAPSDAVPSFEASADPLALRAVDLLALGEVGTEQAATGGRASGHADIPTFAGTFRDHYSFIALSTAPTATEPFAAKGEFEGGYDLVAGGLEVRIHGDVDCLAIMGNQAWVSGPITKYIVNGQSLPTTNRTFLVRVEDNGEGATEPPDRASFIAEPLIPIPQRCRLRAALVMSVNENGNIQVEQR